MNWIQATGKLSYGDNKLTVIIDKEIASLYFTLIPKYFRAKKQRYDPHISVVRKESPLLFHWGKYEDKEILFSYQDIVYYDETYFWLNVIAPDLEKIREELGLSLISGVTCSPDFRHRFHITIGNRKD